MTHTLRLSVAFHSDSHEERRGRREARARLQEWADAETEWSLVRVHRLHRPYEDRATWWQADITLGRRCPFQGQQQLGLSA